MNEISRFNAIGDTGKTYLVIEYQRTLISNLISGGRASVAGTTFLKLDDGRDVNDIGEEEDTLFQIVPSGEKLRRL